MISLTVRAELDNDDTAGCHGPKPFVSEAESEGYGGTYVTVSALVCAMVIKLNKSLG
jgi:hypothetical protein